MISENTFNKWFNTVILAGMTVAICLITGIKLSGANAGTALLLVSAFGSLMGIFATVASANARIITFLFGILDVTIYGVVCMINWKNGSSGLGNGLMHLLYFLPMQFIGFWQWKKLGQKKDGKVKARRLSNKGRWLYAALFIVGGVISYVILALADKSGDTGLFKTTALLDALPLICNILGLVLMSTAYMEQWIFWIGVNITSVLMWSNTLAADPSSSYATIYLIKYVFYLINSLNGLRIWWNLSKESENSPH